MSTKKHLRSQVKEITAKVYRRMKYEAENGVEKLSDARWRTAQAVGITLKTKRKRTKSNLDDFDMGILRRTIATFHTEFHELPTLRKLKQVLTERIGFNGCIETLRIILKESGYEWSKIDDNRKALVEKHDIQMLRFQYLRQLKKYRDEGRYIVYTDESYVHTTHLQNMCWKPVKGVSAVQKKLSKGTRVIIVHAGGCEGFVPNASLVYKANYTSGDYHDNMNLDNYKK
ncbi:unnamed protein product [Parnassius apollo]|uniref:(apollo) hypothetical protein n=1 Tax=Parnassius apollo TaxID=110799 RepID=A0A8S3W2E1_PARAO|nr:unnamed protein product [Parnassius apollo]